MSYINEVIAETIILLDSTNTPVTGEAGNFTKTLQKNGSYSATPAITITEIDSVNFKGAYRITYTPDVVGDYSIRISHATYNKSGWVLAHQVVKHESEVIYEANLESNNVDILFLIGHKIDGLVKIDTASVAINIYTSAGVLVNSTSLTNSIVDATTGMFSITWTGGVALISSNTIYSVTITFVDANGTSYTFTEELKME